MKFFNCRDVSDNYINGLNTLIGICALFILVAAGVTRAKYEDGLDEAFDEAGIDMSFGALGAIVALSILGCVGLKKRNSWCLAIYLLATTVLVVFLTAKIAALNAFVHSVDEITEEPIEETDDFDAIATEALLAIYDSCCVATFGAVEPKACDESETIACISDQERFEDILELVPSELCSELEKESFNGAFIVGDITEGGCGGGDPKVFIDSLGKYLSNLLEPLGYVSGVFVIIMLLTDIVLLVIFFQKRKELFTCCNKEEEAEKDEPTKVTDVGANQLV